MKDASDERLSGAEMAVDDLFLLQATVFPAALERCSNEVFELQTC